MKNEMKITTPVILLAGNISLASWEFGAVSCSIPVGAGWKQEIINKLKALCPEINVRNRLKKVSGSLIPSQEDVEAITKFALKEFEKIDANYIVSRLGTRIARLDQVKWTASKGKVKLDFRHEEALVMKYFILKYLSKPGWDRALEKEMTFHFANKFTKNKEEIPVFETSSFKGLEAEGVILVTKKRSFSYFNELYVASSRAKQVLAIVIDKENENFYVP